MGSHFKDERDYVIVEVKDSGDRNRTITFVWKDGRRSSITFDVAFDSPEMRDRLIRKWAQSKRIYGADRRTSGSNG